MLARLSYIVMFLMAGSIGLVFVVLSEVQERHGLSDLELGVVAGTGFLAALVTQLTLAPLIDRGHASGIAWVAVVVGGGGTIAFAYGTNALVLAGARGAAGIGIGLFGLVARKAVIGLDAVGGGEKVGRLLSAGVAGFISGPALGAVLSKISYEAPFLVVGGAVIVLGIAAARLISGAPIAVAPADYSDLARLLRRPRVQVAILNQFVVFGFIGVFDATVDVFLTDEGLTDTEIALGLLAVGAPMLVLPARAGRLAERIGGGRVLVPALVVAIPTMVLFGHISNVWMFVGLGALYSVTESYSSVSGQVLVLEATGAERAAVGSSILEAVGMAVAAVAAFAGPPIYGAHGSVRLYGATAVVCLAAFGLILLRMRAIALPAATASSDEVVSPAV